jgi:hypothetical protein
VADAKGVLTRDAANLRWAADRNRLLPGELPQTPYSEDAEHWVRVYNDLLGFNIEMMGVIEKRLLAMPATHGGPEGADLALLRAHVRRLRWRLSYWQRRRRSLLTQRNLATPVQPPATAAVP